MKESLDMRGQLTLFLSDREGRIVETQGRKNRIVKSGRVLVAQLFGGVTSGTPPASVTHMGVGAGGTAPTDDDTDLRLPRVPRKPFTVEYSDFNEIDPVTGNISVKRSRARLTTVYEFDEANDPAVPLQEAAVFNAESGGVMYNRVVFEEVTKTDAFKLTLQWDIIF